MTTSIPQAHSITTCTLQNHTHTVGTSYFAESLFLFGVSGGLEVGLVEESWNKITSICCHLTTVSTIQIHLCLTAQSLYEQEQQKLLLVLTRYSTNIKLRCSVPFQIVSISQKHVSTKNWQNWMSSN